MNRPIEDADKYSRVHMLCYFRPITWSTHDKLDSYYSDLCVLDLLVQLGSSAYIKA